MTARRPRNPATRGPALDRATVDEVSNVKTKEPLKGSPYLDSKHICAYDGPTKGCRCES